MRLPAVPVLLWLTACATTAPIPPAWTSPPAAPQIRAVTLSADGKVSLVPPPPVDTPVRLEGNRLYRRDKPLTGAFAAVDSFDYSASRDEVAFSAKREGGFDIGLVAGDGSAMKWMPADPADELAVQWAPRGNKISYVVRAPLGDVVRTLHIPTAFQFVVDFGPARIHALTWDPPAERFAVAYSTVDASDRIEVLRYDGTERRMAVPPAARIAADVVPFAPGALALRPRDVRYEEKLPVVVWGGGDWMWSDALAALMKDARVAAIVTRGEPQAEVWARIRDTPWLDPSRMFAVQSASGEGVRIVADAGIPPGRWRRGGNTVSVAPAAIQSFAAGFIADQLKRTGPTHGSSR